MIRRDLLTVDQLDTGTSKVGAAAAYAGRSASSAGVPTRTIQLLSGHSSLEQLQRYIDVSDQQKRQAANAFG